MHLMRIRVVVLAALLIASSAGPAQAPAPQPAGARQRVTPTAGHRRTRATSTWPTTSTRASALNILGAYRVNAGTAVLVGYDDHSRQGTWCTHATSRPTSTCTTGCQRTGRAVFAKGQYLYRF